MQAANQALAEALKAKGRHLGFSHVGIVSAQPSPQLAAYERWIAAGMHGSMGYLARPDRLARRRDLNVILGNVRSIVCVALDYATPPPPTAVLQDPARGRISNYAWQQDYHDIMTPRLKRLAGWLADEMAALDPQSVVESKVYVDTGAILERSHAAAAGLGFTGKNSMLIAPQHGSFFFLGELLTTLDLPPDPPRTMPTCGSCTRCLTACPTDAFPEPYVLDARRCISYLTIEHKGWIPRELRPLLGNWIYGCDICQDVCPFNRFAPESEEAGFAAAAWERAAPPLLELLALTPADFRAQFAHSPIARIRYPRFMRNVVLAAGNWGERVVLEPLLRLLSDREPLVRGHAAWALAQLRLAVGEKKAVERALREQLASEEDGETAVELSSALTSLHQ